MGLGSSNDAEEELELEVAKRVDMKKRKEAVREFLRKHSELDVELDDQYYMTEEEKRDDRSLGGLSSW